MERLNLKYIIAVFLLLLTATPVFAGSFGIAGSYVLIPRDPENVHGGQLMLTYDPCFIKWKGLSIYFDAGYTYFYAPHLDHHRSISIISAAPVLRFQFHQLGPVKPYIDLSVGPSLSNTTRFESHNLGIHFLFQDRLGAGLIMGDRDQFSFGVSAIHYSNAHLSAHNSGISIPLIMNASYTFA